MNEHESLIKQLKNLADNSQPNSHFVDNLENQLRATHLEMQPEKRGKHTMFSRFFNQTQNKTKKRKRKPSSPMRWLAAILAFVIIGGLFLTMPPLQKMSLSVMDYFYPPEVEFFQASDGDIDENDINSIVMDETEPVTSGFFFRSMSTLAQTDERVEFDFLILPEQENVEIAHISADYDALLMIYHVKIEAEENQYTEDDSLSDEGQQRCLELELPEPICLSTGEYPSVISLYQLTFPDGLPVPMTAFANDFEQINVRINGSAGAYVQSGLWSLSMPIYKEGNWRGGTMYMQIGNAHRLAWQDGDIVYVLTMTEYLADSVEDVLAVAESLIPYVPEDS